MRRGALACLLILFIGIVLGQEKKQMDKKELIYVMDPQCGWCYGNAGQVNRLMAALGESYTIRYRAGGMWLGDDAPQGGQGLAQYIQANAPRVEQHCGVVFSESFYALCTDSSYRFSSLEPSAAMQLVMQEAPDKLPEFSKALQEALYLKGLRLDQLASYEMIFQDLGFSVPHFSGKWLSDENLESTHEMFRTYAGHVQGFPGLLLRTEHGYEMIHSGYFDVDGIVKRLENLK